MELTLDRYYRDQELDAIRRCLMTYPLFTKLPQNFQNQLVSELEKGCNNYTFDKAVIRNLPQIWESSQYVELYSNIGYNLKINIDITSSINKNDSYFVERLCNHLLKEYISVCGSFWDPDIPWNNILSYIESVNPKTAAYLDNNIMNPKSSKKYLDEIKLREQQKIEKKYTEQYQCSRCKARKSTYVAVQARGLDEDLTLVITCAVCSHTWKKN
jgi:DNA-directed RNA polymerase subunit M/transcription elongation factor TFIIS